MAKGIYHQSVGAILERSEWESTSIHLLAHGNSFPAAPENYELFFRDDLGKWYIYWTGAWVALAYDEADVISKIATHAALTTGVHGVGASVVDSVANRDAAIATHAALPNVHHAQLHAATHGPAQGDALKLDDLAQPDDNTDLNASTTKHGLLLKLGGGTTNFLRADGSWAAPAAALTTYRVTSTTTFTTTSTSYVDVTGMTLTFTVGAANKVLVLFTCYAIYNTTAAKVCDWAILRGTTILTEKRIGGANYGASLCMNSAIFTLDSPGAGSFTYKLQMKVNGGTGYLSALATAPLELVAIVI